MVYLAGIIAFAGIIVLNGIFAYQAKNVGLGLKEITEFYMKVSILILLANFFISYGISLAYKHIDNMTFVFALSKFLDVIAILLLSFVFASEIPTLKVIGGLILVVTGLIIIRI